MAYAFEKILSQVDPNKINLFAGQAGGAQPEVAGTQAPETKTETGGAVGTGGGAGAQVQAASVPSEGAAGRSVGTQRAFEASQKSGPVNLSGRFQNISAGLKKRSEDLQAEANKYATDADAANTFEEWMPAKKPDQTVVDQATAPQQVNLDKKKLVDPTKLMGKPPTDRVETDAQKRARERSMQSKDRILGALGGNTEDEAALATILNRTTVDPVPVWNPKTDYIDEDIEMYGSMPGVKKILSREFGPGYTAGMATFDAARLMNDPQYQAQLAQVKKEQADLVKLADGYKDAEKGLEAIERKEAKERLDAAQKHIKDTLGDNLKNLEMSNEKEFEEFQQDIKDVMTVGSEEQKKIIQENQQQIQKRIQEIIQIRPDLAKYLTPEFITGFNIKIEDYVRGYSGKLSAEDFYDEGEANLFNKIMGWLGKGGQAKMAGTRPDAYGYLDVDAYTAALQGAAEEKNRAADIAARQAIDQARARAEARSAQARSQVADPNFLATLAANARASLGRGDIAGDIVDPYQFYRGGEVSGSAMDYLDPADVAAVNAAYEELMTPMNVQAGRLFNAPAYTFDEQAYKNAVLARLNELAAPPIVSSPIPPAFPGSTAITFPLDYEGGGGGGSSMPGGIPGKVISGGKKVLKKLKF